MTAISTKLLYTIGQKLFTDMKYTLYLWLEYYNEKIICEIIIATCTLHACTSHVARVHKNLIPKIYIGMVHPQILLTVEISHATVCMYSTYVSTHCH